jgi:hypothetical protein
MLPRGMFSPDSSRMAVWDLMQIVLLIYVAVTVPLRACFDIEVDPGSFAFWFEVLVVSEHDARRTLLIGARDHVGGLAAILMKPRSQVTGIHLQFHSSIRISQS